MKIAPQSGSTIPLIKLLTPLLLFFSSPWAQAQPCLVTPDEMAAALSSTLGKVLGMEETQAGTAGVFENGYVCFLEKAPGALPSEQSLYPVKVGSAECHWAQIQSRVARYDFEMSTGQFTGCRIKSRRIW